MNGVPGEQPKVRGLLLDFGGVISRTLFEQLDAVEARLGLPPGTLSWRGPLDPANDALWQAMQRGELTERGYWNIRARETGALLGEAWDVRTFLHRSRSPDPNDVVRPEAARTIRQARQQGLAVGVLSNELELFYGKPFLEGMEILKEVHCIVDASHTRVLKPDPRSYEMGLAALGTTAGDTLFVDDQPRNVEGARREGLRTVWFDVRDPAESCRAVEALLA